MFSKGRERGESSGPWVAEQKPTEPRAQRFVQEKSPLNFLLGSGCTLVGQLSLSGETMIDGSFQGEIAASGVLTIGAHGEVEANINGETVKVFGRINGNIDCGRQLELHAGARVLGDISSPSVIIEDGVIFEGRCTMKEKVKRDNRGDVFIEENDDEDSDDVANKY